MNAVAPITAEAEVATLLDRWNAAVLTREPKAVAALYAPDAVLVPTISNRIRTTPAEIEEYFQHFLMKCPRGTVLDAHIRIIGDMALSSGVYEFKISSAEGDMSVKCRFSFVYRKRNDAWRIIEHHSSFMPE